MRAPRPSVVCLSALLALAACGDATIATDTTTDSSPSGAVTTTVLTKPSVPLPDELPTELVVTDVTKGNGPVATVGDTVVVHYVGVRSADGQEFDNSYDRGEPFAVQLGANQVIAGWEQGLLGAQRGGRLRLDIPAELAYGDSPPTGGQILAGDALTFVVDVVVVLPASSEGDEPKVTVAAAGNVEQLVIADLVEGGGETLLEGQNVAVHIVSFRADTGERLGSDWGSPPLTFTTAPDSLVYPGLLAAVDGMAAGGRRQAQIPFAEIFDGLGSENLGLPPSVDLVVLIDLILIY